VVVLEEEVVVVDAVEVVTGGSGVVGIEWPGGTVVGTAGDREVQNRTNVTPNVIDNNFYEINMYFKLNNYYSFL
jgi:hypothetical protein